MKSNSPTAVRSRFVVYSIVVLIASACGAYLWFIHQSVILEASAAATRIANNDEQSKLFAAEMKAKRIAEEKARKQAAKKAAAAAAKGKATAAMQQPTHSPCNTASAHADPSSIDVLVNKKHCLRPVTYAPNDLRVVLGATLRSEAAIRYRAMINAAAKSNIAIRSTSSYRSYAQQVSTYNHWVAVNGSVAAADTVSARPGYSEHQTGLTVDVATGGCALECFGTTSAYAWMKAHAHDYGFIERYPSGKSGITGYSPEPWHYRYVGRDVASDMKTKQINTLEEYWNMPGGGY